MTEAPLESRTDPDQHRPRQGQDHRRHGHGAARGGQWHARADAAVSEGLVALRRAGRGAGFGGNFVLKQMGRGFVKVGGAETDPEDIRLVEAAWAEAREAILSGEWDMVVLDEINYAIGYGMLDPAEVAETLRSRPEMVHVILTGRNAHPCWWRLADTVTEMREVKHAYQKGILAQRGIEY